MSGHDRDGYGNFIWKCRYCGWKVSKDTPQGRGLARSNHLRKHSVYTSRTKRT